MHFAVELGFFVLNECYDEYSKALSNLEYRSDFPMGHLKAGTGKLCSAPIFFQIIHNVIVTSLCYGEDFFYGSASISLRRLKAAIVMHCVPGIYQSCFLYIYSITLEGVGYGMCFVILESDLNSTIVFVIL